MVPGYTYVRPRYQTRSDPQTIQCGSWTGVPCPTETTDTTRQAAASASVTTQKPRRLSPSSLPTQKVARTRWV